MRSIALTYTPHLTRTIAILASALMLSVFLYGFFLLEAVAHAASLTDATHSIRSLQGEVSKLEEQYLSATKDITRERAAELGFVAPISVSTVFAVNPAKSLLVRNN